jgi:hypothetical protein
MYLFPHTYVHSLGIHVFISTHIRTQPRNPAETENIHHVCMYTYIHAKQNPAQTRKARAQGERTGKGKEWLRFGPASETVQQNGARTRDLFVGFPARRAPDTLVKSHGADGRAGWNYGPASEGGVGQTGFEPTPAVFRRRGSNARGLSAWWVQTRLRRYLRGPPQRKSVTSESNTQPLCSRGTKYKATECLGAALPSA